MRRMFVLFCLLTVSEMAAAQVKIDDLTEKNSIYYYQGLPYTGDAYGHANNTDDPIRQHYVDGVANGVLTGYFDKKHTRVKWQVPVIDGKREGRYVHYYENGAIAFTARMRGGQLDGRRYCYTEDGILWHIHMYRKGREHGPNRMFYQDSGNLMAERNFRRGKLHGPFIGYTDTGYLSRTGRYRRGEQTGIWRTYDRDGNVIRKVKYRAGVLKD